ncbi:MAG: hypothetical protein AABX01_02935 [Candidatus Micrarchaeota archaeon]
MAIGICAECGSNLPITVGHVGVSLCNGGTNTESQCLSCNSFYNLETKLSQMKKTGEFDEIISHSGRDLRVEAGSIFYYQQNQILPNITQPYSNSRQIQALNLESWQNHPGVGSTFPYSLSGGQQNVWIHYMGVFRI